MSGKFMKIKKVTISMITAMIIASTLVGCAAGNSNELMNLMENNESIEIIVAEPSYAEPDFEEYGAEKQQDWISLAYRQNNLDFRLSVDEVLNITPYNTTGKNGVLYINSNGKHTDNSTMYDAFMNQAFIDNYWSNKEIKSQLKALGDSLYADTNPYEKEVGFINGYYDLFNVSMKDRSYLNPGTTVTRAEFLSAVYKSYSPVSTDLAINGDLAFYMPEDENLLYVSQMLDMSYLNTEDFSLNDRTYNSTITKAEAIYTIVKTFYSEEFDKTTGSETLAGFTNGGEIAVEQGFIKGDEKPNCWKAAELSYAIENDILPQDLYRAMVVAEKHGLLDDMLENEDMSFEWSEGITKADTIRLLIDTFETLGKENGYKTNTESGSANIEDDLSTTHDLVMQDIYNKLSCLQNVTYEDGKYVYTDEWKQAMLDNFEYFDGAPDSVVNDFLEDFAEDGYNSYNGETVYNKMKELSEAGFLYTPPVKEETTSNSNDGSSQNKQDQSSSNQEVESTDNSESHENNDIPDDTPDLVDVNLGGEGTYEHDPNFTLIVPGQ